MIQVPNHHFQGHNHHRPHGQLKQCHTLAPRAHLPQDTMALPVHGIQDVPDSLLDRHDHRDTLVRFREYRDRVTLLVAASASTRTALELSLDLHSRLICW